MLDAKRYIGTGVGAMRLGLFSNGQRRNRLAKVSYQDDLEEIILADELGIEEAWISEHGVFVSFHAPDQLPSADMFICKAAALTKQIRMGPGIRALPFFHPLQVATDTAVCDHLCDGRYMAGFGLGIGDGGGLRGTLPAPQRVMMREAVDIILKAWSAPEPFDWSGEVWQGKNWKIVPKPMTQPRMDVGIACARTSSTLELAAEKGFFPLLSWTTSAAHLNGMIKTYLETENPADPPSRNRIRVSRFVYVCDSVAEAKRDLANADFVPIHSGRRLDEFVPPGGTRNDVTMDYLIDRGAFFCGDPDRVTRQIKDFYQEIGGFGVLLLVTGKDWATNEQRARSMRRFVTEVAPRLDALAA
jgi:alkanesulfonate monooxygenase SsuD/methylene tetrahydromethanopterin reductase-like flavin-dependent oxidoreductase (luciferase family)